MKKIWNLVCLVLIFSCLAGNPAALAQDGPLSRPVSVTVDNGTLYDAVVQIEKQTSLMFFYKDQDIDPARRIDLRVQEKPLSEVLDQLTAQVGLAWQLSGSHIMLTPAKKTPEGPVTVSGRVTDAQGLPVIGAAVLVKGTTIGSSTDADGAYTLQVPPPAATAVLAVNYLGYEPAESPVGSRTRIDFTLHEQAQAVDAVVVTALGIKRSEKALSYNVQQVASEDIVANKDVNFSFVVGCGRRLEGGHARNEGNRPVVQCAVRHRRCADVQPGRGGRYGV